MKGTTYSLATSQEDIDNAVDVANKILLTYEPYKRKLIRHKPLGLTFKEIAAIEGITVQKAREIVDNAIKKIRNTYGIVINKEEIN